MYRLPYTPRVPMGDSFKVKRGGEQYAKYRAEETGLALAVEQADGHLCMYTGMQVRVCEKVDWEVCNY